MPRYTACLELSGLEFITQDLQVPRPGLRTAPLYCLLLWLHSAADYPAQYNSIRDPHKDCSFPGGLDEGQTLIGIKCVGQSTSGSQLASFSFESSSLGGIPSGSRQGWRMPATSQQQSGLISGCDAMLEDL